MKSVALAIEERSPQAVLANVTGARKGILYDGWLDDRFARTLLEALERGEQTATRRGSVRAVTTAAFVEAAGGSDGTSRVIRLCDGRIVDVWSLEDTLDRLRQLGLTDLHG